MKKYSSPLDRKVLDDQFQDTVYQFDHVEGVVDESKRLDWRRFIILCVNCDSENKTLNMFGRKDENKAYHPFHIYSMRQAIEENFIFDVLSNYMT